MRGEGTEDILFVSHRWESSSKPDLDGVQLTAVKDYLHEHRNIAWVWYDYWSVASDVELTVPAFATSVCVQHALCRCMPQRQEVDAFDDRNEAEVIEMKLMLSSIADLYLTTRVLIILDMSCRQCPLIITNCQLNP